MDSAARERIRARLCEAIGYVFKDDSLLERALTHRSWVHDARRPDERSTDGNNERLEFLGDAVIDLVVGHSLMERLPDAREGMLSRYRALVVSESGLAEAAKALNIGDFLHLGRGEERSGGRKKNSILADAIEAVIGAVFIDGGYLAAERVVLRFATRLVDAALREPVPDDNKTRLQERTQSTHQGAPTYRVASTLGPDHRKRFNVTVCVGQAILGCGIGKSKKEAEQAAAYAALETIRSAGGIERPKPST